MHRGNLVLGILHKEFELFQIPMHLFNEDTFLSELQIKFPHNALINRHGRRRPSFLEHVDHIVSLLQLTQ